MSGATALPSVNPSLPSSRWDPGRDGMRRIRCSGFISAGLQLESIPLKWQQKADGGGRLTPDVRGVQTDRGGGGVLGPNRTHPNLFLRTCLSVKVNCLMHTANSPCRDRTFLLLLHSYNVFSGISLLCNVALKWQIQYFSDVNLIPSQSQWFCCVFRIKNIWQRHCGAC